MRHRDYVMNANSREATCQQLAADKRRLGLPLEDVRRIDAYLANYWGITMPMPPDQWEEHLAFLAGEALTAKYRELNDELALRYETESPVPMELETAFYNVLADDRISGHVHSRKRAEILDAACVLLHLIREFGITGPVLDVGCHIGYHAHLLARETTATVYGIDLCSHAIEAAHAKTTGTPRLSYSVGTLADRSADEAFELIYAVRSIALDKTTARQISAALKPGGVAVILPRLAPDASSRGRKAFREARLGWGFSDVVGGWVGEGRGYEAGAVFVFIKDGSASVPAGFLEQTQSVWNPYFRDYANAPDTPPAEKNQAYFRSKWRKAHG